MAGVFLAAALGVAATALASAGSAPAPPPDYVVLHLDGEVAPVMQEYIQRGIALANDRRAVAVVIEMNTPGGLDTSMRAIIQAIFSSRVPVIGYVAPSGSRAASAGFYILLSCDLAAMAPGTNTGAAHPVVLGGEPDKIESQKIENDAAAFMRSIATRRHRNLDLAEAGVLQSKSFTGAEALSGGLIDLTADNLPDLIAKLDGRTLTRLDGSTSTLALAGAQPLDFTMSLRERVLNMDSSLAFVLLAVGALLLYLEFSHPGMVVPGVAGVILIAIALFALSLLPISYAGASLLVLALVLFALEAKFHSHGVLAIGGVVAMAFGAVMLVDSPEPAARVQAGVAWAVAAGFGICSMTLLELVMRARRRKVVTGIEGLIGEEGVTETGLNPSGSVQVHGELWRAEASAPVPPGGHVRVRAVRGLRLEVEPSPPNGRLRP